MHQVPGPHGLPVPCVEAQQEINNPQRLSTHACESRAVLTVANHTGCSARAQSGPHCSFTSCCTYARTVLNTRGSHDGAFSWEHLQAQAREIGMGCQPDDVCVCARVWGGGGYRKNGQTHPVSNRMPFRRGKRPPMYPPPSFRSSGALATVVILTTRQRLPIQIGISLWRRFGVPRELPQNPTPPESSLGVLLVGRPQHRCCAVTCARDTLL